MRSRPIIGCAVFVLALALGVSAALGFSLQTKTASKNVAGLPGRGSPTAKCPSGKKVVSGGFDAPGFRPSFAGGPAVLAYASHRTSSRNWTVSGKNQSATAGSIKAYAYCAKGLSISTKSSSVLIGAQPATGSATATCSSGHVAVSGGSDSPGFSENPGARIFPYKSYRSGKRSWTVTGRNFGSTSGTLKAYVHCATQISVKTKKVTITVGSDPVPFPVTADCPNGRKALSGGFSTPSFAPVGTSAILPFSFRRAGSHSWTAKAFTDGGGTAGNFTLYAYCVK